MRKKTLFHRLTLGLLMGALIMPPQQARAQFGLGLVFDAENYTLQVEKKVEEAVRHVQIFENAINQLTTLRGVLGKAENLVKNDSNAMKAMASIGRTVRTSLKLKDEVQAIIKTRLTMLKSIDDRLRNGIFDPEADLRDLEDYLRVSVGRSSQDTLANLTRLQQMDNTLERMIYELTKLQAAKSKTSELKNNLTDQLDDLNARPESERDATSIASVMAKISNCEVLINQYNAQIEELNNKIKDHIKKYQVVMDERIKFAEQVEESTKAWADFDNAVDEFQKNDAAGN